jgi:hypothetical protein
VGVVVGLVWTREEDKKCEIVSEGRAEGTKDRVLSDTRRLNSVKFTQDSVVRGIYPIYILLWERKGVRWRAVVSQDWLVGTRTQTSRWPEVHQSPRNKKRPLKSTSQNSDARTRTPKGRSKIEGKHGQPWRAQRLIEVFIRVDKCLCRCKVIEQQSLKVGRCWCEESVQDVRLECCERRSTVVPPNGDRTPREGRYGGMRAKQGSRDAEWEESGSRVFGWRETLSVTRWPSEP